MSGLPEEITFTVPLTPPSANHYVKHTRLGHHYLTREAKAFLEAVWVCCARRKIRAKHYFVESVVYVGKGQKGDSDNFNKCILDGLVKAGVIHSDANVDCLTRKRRDPENPRTRITVRAMTAEELRTT